MKIERGNPNSWRLSSIAEGGVFEYQTSLFYDDENNAVEHLSDVLGGSR